MKLYLALFSCEKYKKKCKLKESHVQYSIYTHVEKKKEHNTFFPTSEKNPEQQNKESEMFHCTQDTVGVMASCSFSKLLLTVIAWGQPVPGYFFQLQLSGTKKHKSKADNRKHITTLLMLQVIGAM